MSSLTMVKKAFNFAEKAHKGQYRKHTGEPYIDHPVGVVDILYDVISDHDVIASAFLHDVVEDTDITLDKIRYEFGERVRTLVWYLTDISKPEDGNRKARKTIDLIHLSSAPPDAKTVKLADMIHNAPSIIEHDPKFAKVWMKEYKDRLEILKDGNQVLYKKAKDILDEYDKNQLC